MEVKCHICGRIEEITKIHKDYPKIVSDPKSIYVCHRCGVKIRVEALGQEKPVKPI